MSHSGIDAMRPDDDEHIDVVHLDLAVGPLGPPPAGRALVVCWWRDLPLGQVAPAAVEAVARQGGHGWPAAVAQAIAYGVTARLRPEAVPAWLPRVRREPGVRSAIAGAVAARDTLAALDELPESVVAGGALDDLTVVLCTRDRPSSLERALAALAAQRAAPTEVIVVDNASTTDATRRLVEGRPNIRYVAEPRPGLSVARNTGIRQARTGLIAFTDDDAIPHPAWTAQIARIFHCEPALLAVTGLVLPAVLDTHAARSFEFDFGGFAQGYVPRRYDADWFARVRGRAAPTWQLGAGANMAFRRRAFAEVGGFDERLGAGAAGCSEDSELWYRLLVRGHDCLYEPAAVVSHHHRDSTAALLEQERAYIEGHMAALFVEFARHRHPGELARALVNLPAFLGAELVSQRGAPEGSRLRAALRGYRRGLRHARAALRDEPAPIVVRSEDPEGVAPLPRRAFLRQNPYPRPYTEGFFFREKMRAIHRVTPARGVRRVLEVGGGSSALTGRLFPGAVVVAVDLDRALRSLPHEQTNTTFVSADAVALPFGDASFDAATFFDVLEHIPDDAAAVAEARRVVRDGGFLVVSTPNERWRFPYYRALRGLCPTDDEVMAEWGHVRRGYRLEDLDDLIGTGRDSTATFITPMTVVVHDLAFSRLPSRLRRVGVRAVAPLAWIGYALHRPTGPGTETAASWQLDHGHGR